MAGGRTTVTRVKAPRPEIYAYHDYRAYLRDAFAFLKKQRSVHSLRDASKQAGVAESYLALVVRGERNLTPKAVDKLAPLLKLRPPERSFLNLLCEVADSDTAEERVRALKKAQRFQSYRDHNPSEIEVYKYLTGWYFVAIREMTGLPDFSLDPKWIQSKLKTHVPIQEIEQATQFLVKNGYIQFDEKGQVRKPDKHLDCVGGVYRVALTKFHQEMLALAQQSIENTPREQRWIDANTFPIRMEEFGELKEILTDCINKVIALATRPREAGDAVYHVCLSAFPLTDPGTAAPDPKAGAPKETSQKAEREKKGAAS